MENKTVANSALEMSTVMQPNQANPAGNVHGGEIMKMMDNAAGVVALRHARSNAVTARVDELVFHHPIFVGNLVTCHAFLAFVGRSSMEIIVSVEVEDLYSESPNKCGLTAYFTMVALDAEGKPIQVPGLKLVNDEEHQRFEEGRQRYEANKLRKQSYACQYSVKT
jgi:acyl-CoA hydrolase